MSSVLNSLLSCTLHPIDCLFNGGSSPQPEIPVPIPPVQPESISIDWDKKIIGLWNEISNLNTVQWMSVAAAAGLVVGTIFIFTRKKGPVEGEIKKVKDKGKGKEKISSKNRAHELDESPRRFEKTEKPAKIEAVSSPAEITSPIVPETPLAIKEQDPKLLFIQFADYLKSRLKTVDQKGAFCGLLAAFHLANGDAVKAKELIKSVINHDAKDEKVGDGINEQLVRLLTIAGSKNLNDTNKKESTSESIISTVNRTAKTPQINSNVNLDSVFKFFAENLSEEFKFKKIDQNNGEAFGYFSILISVYYMSKNKFNEAKEYLKKAEHFNYLYLDLIKNNLTALQTHCDNGLIQQQKMDRVRRPLNFDDVANDSGSEEEVKEHRTEQRGRNLIKNSGAVNNKIPPPPPPPTAQTQDHSDGPPPPPPAPPKNQNKAPRLEIDKKELQRKRKELEKSRMESGSLEKLETKKEDVESSEDEDEAKPLGEVLKGVTLFTRKQNKEPEQTSEFEGATTVVEILGQVTTDVPPTEELNEKPPVMKLIETNTEDVVELFEKKGAEPPEQELSADDTAAARWALRRAATNPISPSVTKTQSKAKK